MKLRHVRTAVIAVGVVVALTGARHSSGGGCGSSHHSSSTSGGSHHDYDDDDYDVDVDVPDVDSGSTGDTSSGSSSSATSDLSIDDCGYDESRGLVATVTASNSAGPTAYTYDFTVVFKDAGGTTLETTTDSIVYVPAQGERTQDVAAPFVPSSPGATDGGTCEITDATKTVV
ncbi:hypothetical protein ABZ354_07520 [Streptomyces sp. NPDC005925]|uniref:hypothetical protein n=1 Tax=Streptomyces sp. NPDC005925 TaxID=3157172 RepID=UPI0033F59357